MVSANIITSVMKLMPVSVDGTVSSVDLNPMALKKTVSPGVLMIEKIPR
jgi:hypothetical protein